MNPTAGAGVGRAAGTLASVLALLALCLATSGCRGKAAPSGEGAGSAKPDALFLSGAPIVPEELESDLGAMGIGRIYLLAATLSPSGKLTVLPPPPAPLRSGVVLTVAGGEGGTAALPGLSGAEATGEAWGEALAGTLAGGEKWGRVVGLHLHLPVDPSQAELLSGLVKGLKKKTSLLVSVTIVPGRDPGRWKSLSGVDEVLAFALGRRPETGDVFVPEPTEEVAKAIPIPFRLLLVPGGYGFAGAAGKAVRRIPDGEVDRLSEDRNLDFDFGQVLSNDVGSVYNFKSRIGATASSTLLAAYGGAARFQVISISDVARLLSAASQWTGTGMKGRVFLVEGLPKDGHLLGFEALRALLLGRPLEPKLDIRAIPLPSKKGTAEFTLQVANAVPLPTELSRLGNWIKIRVDGGVFTGAIPADFDRYELLSSSEEAARPSPFGRATVVKLFENIFVPGESNDAGPFRVAGSGLRVFVSTHLVKTDGRTVETPEVELAVVAPEPTPAPKKGSRRR